MTRQLTTITLYAHVPFDDTYKHVMNWQSEDNLNTFLDRFAHVSEKVSYQNLNKPIRWDTKKEYNLTDTISGNSQDLATTFNVLTMFNYIKIHDVDHNGRARNFYAFITNLEYYNDGTTFIYFSVDMWNTYHRNVNWQVSQAMIQRGFVREVNSDATAFTNMFTKVKNNPDEIGGDGCDHLQESNTIAFHKVKGNDSVKVRDNEIKFILFTTQPKDAATDSGSDIGLYSQYLYYFIAYNPRTSHLFNVQVDGKDISKHSDKKIEEVYADLSKAKEFAGSDSLIVDSEIYNYLGLPFEIDTEHNTINFTQKSLKLSEKSTYLIKINQNALKDFKAEQGICRYDEKSKIGGSTNLLQNLVMFYQHLYGADVPLKIMSTPYSKLYFTNGRGMGVTADIMKFTDLTTEFFSVRRFGAISENGHETYAVNNYNRESTADQGNFVTYENLMDIDDSARDVPIVLDNYTMYLNANRNQIANVRANAKMNLQLAKESNLISLQNSNRSRAASENIMNYKNSRNMGMAQFDAATGVVAGGAKGLMSGGLLGGLMGAAGGAISGGLNLYKTGYNNTTAANALAMQNAASAQNDRANFAFQNKVATNNYEQTIRSQNAMLADTRNHNDVIAHEGSNYLVGFQNGATETHWQIFTCQNSVMQNVILYFRLFGYEVNQYGLIYPWFNVKVNFNYVRTSNCYLSGTLPTEAANTLETMLDNGVTVWTDTGVDNWTRFVTRDQSNNLFNANSPFD